MKSLLARGGLSSARLSILMKIQKKKKKFNALLVFMFFKEDSLTR